MDESIEEHTLHFRTGKHRWYNEARMAVPVTTNPTLDRDRIDAACALIGAPYSSFLPVLDALFPEGYTVVSFGKPVEESG